MKINLRNLVGGAAALMLTASGSGCSNGSNKFEGHYFGVGSNDTSYVTVEADVVADGKVTGTLTYYDGNSTIPLSVSIPGADFGTQSDIIGQVDGDGTVAVVTVDAVTTPDLVVTSSEPVTITGTFGEDLVFHGTISDPTSPDRHGSFMAQPVAATDEIRLACGQFAVYDYRGLSAYERSPAPLLADGDSIVFSVNRDTYHGLFISFDDVNGYAGIEGAADIPEGTGCAATDCGVPTSMDVAGTLGDADVSMHHVSGVVQLNDTYEAGAGYLSLSVPEISLNSSDSNFQGNFWANTNFCYSWNLCPASVSGKGRHVEKC